MLHYIILTLFVAPVFCTHTSSYRSITDTELSQPKAGPSIVSEEEIFPREMNNPFNVQTMSPSPVQGLTNKPNQNQGTMYLGSFQIIAMPMTAGLPSGFPTMTSFGSYPNMFGNKNE